MVEWEELSQSIDIKEGIKTFKSSSIENMNKETMPPPAPVAGYDSSHKEVGDTSRSSKEYPQNSNFEGETNNV